MGGLFSNMATGSGFLEGIETEILDAAFVMYDFNGTADVETPCVYLEVQGEEMEKPAGQYWSIGKADMFSPTEDGKGLTAKKPVHANSNAGMLIASFINAGLDPAVVDKLDEDITVLVGMKVRWTRVARDKKAKNTTLVVDEITSGPVAEADPEAAAVAFMVGLLSGAPVNMKDIPKLTKDAPKEVRAVIMRKGFLDRAEFAVDKKAGIISLA